MKQYQLQYWILMYMRLVILWRSSKEANTDIKFIQTFVILMNFSITVAA